MVDCLERLLRFYGPNTKAVVFAHNSQIGRSSATSMREEGLINLGELAIQRFGPSVVYTIGLAVGAEPSLPAVTGAGAGRRCRFHCCYMTAGRQRLSL